MTSTHAAKDETDVANLKLGQYDQFIVCLLLRFWDSKNIKKQGEFMGITVLLLDAKDSVIHGFITAARSNHYRPYLKAGSIVRVSHFEVARCANTYKLTDHPFLFRFIPRKTIEEVMVDCPLIGPKKFMLRTFDSLRGLTNTNLELPDVVGHIQSVQGSNLTQPGVSTRVVVYLSLWDDVASVFRGLPQKGERTQTIMVVTTVNPKLFVGNLYLKSTPATSFYFDPRMEVVSSFTTSLGEPIAAGFTCTDTKEGIKKKEVVSIGELNKFITDSNEHVRMAALTHEFQYATSDMRLHETLNSILLYRHRKLTSFVGPALLRYRVELCVDDGVDNATFVVFDREMVKITKQSVVDLTLHGAGENEDLPACVRSLAGKEFVFHIHDTPFNFSPSHRTFTVLPIIDTIPPEVMFVKHIGFQFHPWCLLFGANHFLRMQTFDTQTPQDNDGSCSNPSSSVRGPTVQEEKLPPPVSTSKSMRKRPRE
ncbi:unnamed protein product [Cochlearia groenlandica]